VTTTSVKTVREGSASKRAAILTAARELFLAEGFERVSVDAISARAEVSKRTLYDYFGDKRTLLLAVIEQALASLSAAVNRAIDEHLTDVDDLEDALIGLARDITTSAMGSSDYAALRQLVSMEQARLPGLRELTASFGEPEDALAKRFAEFDRRGLLSAPRPRLAADHFTALTLSPSVQGFSVLDVDTSDSAQIIRDGVQAFLRAYGAAGAPH
jgi:TetR/AcrR family transcriptional repressor of mexJK operon